MMGAFIDGMNAWNQVGFLFGGLIMLALGGACLADFAWWRLKAERYKGTITAVRAGKSGSNGATIYYPVVQYTGKDGQAIQGETNNGSSILTNKIPGREVEILVMPRDRHTVRVKGFFGLVMGLIFAVPGFILLGVAFLGFDFSIYTILIGLALLGYGGFKFSKFIKPRDQWENVSVFQERKKKERAEKREKMEVLGLQEVLQRLQKQDSTNARWLPVGILIGLCLAGLGIHLALDQKYIEEVGVRTEGRVVQVISESDSDGGYIYYPVVEFRLPAGQAITFRDKVGSSPASYRVGETVDVLHDSDKPGKAMIDRGIGNWIPSFACMGIGAAIVFFALNSLLAIRSRKVEALENAEQPTFL